MVKSGISWNDGISRFFVCWYKFMQIKRWLKMSVVGIVKNGCGQSCDGTLKLTVSVEWTDRINWVFACWYRFTKIISWSEIYWVGMVKNRCGQPGHRTLKLNSSQKWKDGLFILFYFIYFFACSYKFRKAKNWFNDFWVGFVKNGSDLFSSWDPKICCILRINLWIVIFSMLIVTQYLLVRLISWLLNAGSPLQLYLLFYFVFVDVKALSCFQLLEFFWIFGAI